MDVLDFKGHEPLSEYPWSFEVERILTWLRDKKPDTKAFVFDIIMSMAYVDAAGGIERY